MRRPFWLIVHYQSGRMEVLRTTLASDEKALPVFSFEEEARMFLELGALDGWRVREPAAGKLTSVLFGPCAGVRRVALDQLPSQDAGCVARPREHGAFMESYLKNEEISPFATGSEHGRRQGAVITRGATLKRG